MYISMEEAVCTFQILVEADQRNGVHHKKFLLEEDENPVNIPNKEWGEDQYTKRLELF